MDISFLLLALELFVTFPLHWPGEGRLVRNVPSSSGCENILGHKMDEQPAEKFSFLLLVPIQCLNQSVGCSAGTQTPALRDVHILAFSPFFPWYTSWNFPRNWAVPSVQSPHFIPACSCQSMTPSRSLLVPKGDLQTIKPAELNWQ